jgi:hypothetical protein
MNILEAADCEIADSPSPIADLEHPFALSLAIIPATSVSDKADCKSMFQIGERRLRIGDFGDR